MVDYESYLSQLATLERLIDESIQVASSLREAIARTHPEIGATTRLPTLTESHLAVAMTLVDDLGEIRTHLQGYLEFTPVFT